MCVLSLSLSQVKFMDLLRLNAPDWFLVITGILMSGLVGCLFPLMSIFFSEMLEVCVCVCVWGGVLVWLDCVGTGWAVCVQDCGWIVCVCVCVCERTLMDRMCGYAGGWMDG